MALRPEPVHPMWLRATTDIESPELTIFYRVLTAAYAHDAPGAAPPPPRSQLLVPPPIPGTKRTKDMIDWEGKRRQAESDDEADSSDEEGRRRTRRRVKGKQKMRATTVTADILRSELYEPFGQWAWTAHHAMKNIQTKIHIHGASAKGQLRAFRSLGHTASGKCSSSVRTCTIAGRPLSVLSHQCVSTKAYNIGSANYTDLAGRCWTEPNCNLSAVRYVHTYDVSVSVLISSVSLPFSSHHTTCGAFKAT